MPIQYKQSVMTEISTGVITRTTYNAITQDVTSKMLNYCKHPTIQQVEVVASKIVSIYPVLADTMGTGHVSIIIIIIIKNSM